MDRNILQTVLSIMFMVALSAFFSASETAFTSVNRIRLKNQAARGDKRSQRALKLTRDYDNVLSTILVGNNVVNIISSATATLLFVSLSPRYGTTLATIVMTVVVLIFGEITPKTLAKENAEKFAKFSAPVLSVFMLLLKPVNLFFQNWKNLLDKVFKFEDTSAISEEELISIVNEAETAGGIDDYEVELIRSAIQFNDMEAGSILTPRVDVIGADIEAPIEEFEQLFTEHNFSRLVIYEETIDNVVGVLHEKDFNRLLRRSQKKNVVPSVSSIVKKVIFVPPSMKLYKLLRSMQFDQLHMAVVTDEYGGTIGIVTLEDVLEELVGEIWDESDIIRQETQLLEDGSYRIMGSMSLERVFDLLNLADFDENEFISNTLSGFVTEELGRIPEDGDSFVYKGALFSVLKTKDRRVLQVRVDMPKRPSVALEEEKETDN